MAEERTPEQLEAQEQLQIAIEKHIQAFRAPYAPPDTMEISGDWLVIAGVTSLDLTKDDERRYAYHLAFSTGEQPEHIAYGLLREAEKLLDES